MLRGTDEFKVGDIKTLKLADEAKARSILENVCKQVQPIMRKHQWVVPLVSEFNPRSPNLLGLNVGGGGGRTKEIKIRLRQPGAVTDFFPYEHALGTMLHELTHNVQGPHNAAFYKLLEEITEECEELMARGISGSGEGFDAPSVGRLGAHSFIPAHNPPPEKRREAMLKAAEARAKVQSLMTSGARKLGGNVRRMKGMKPGEAAAAAAERRAADNLWCPNEMLEGHKDGDVDQRAHDIEDSPTMSPPASAPLRPKQGAAIPTFSLPQAAAAAAAGPSTSRPTTSTSATTSKQPTASTSYSCPRPNSIPTGQTKAVAGQPSTRLTAGRSASGGGSGGGSGDVVDLTLSDSEEEKEEKGATKGKEGQEELKKAAGPVPKRRRVIPIQWSCPCCTLFNAPEVPRCDACDTQQPRPQPQPQPKEGGLQGDWHNSAQAPRHKLTLPPLPPQQQQQQLQSQNERPLPPLQQQQQQQQSELQKERRQQETYSQQQWVRQQQQRPWQQQRQQGAPTTRHGVSAKTTAGVPPAAHTDGHTNGVGGAHDASQRTWACSFCTLVNAESDAKCAACDTWRFSRGPPVAVQPSGGQWD